MAAAACRAHRPTSDGVVRERGAESTHDPASTPSLDNSTRSAMTTETNVIRTETRPTTPAEPAIGACRVGAAQIAFQGHEAQPALHPRQPAAPCCSTSSSATSTTSDASTTATTAPRHHSPPWRRAPLLPQWPDSIEHPMAGRVTNVPRSTAIVVRRMSRSTHRDRLPEICSSFSTPAQQPTPHPLDLGELASGAESWMKSWMTARDPHSN